MKTHNGVEKTSKRRSKMMEKITKGRPKKMDKKRKKEAEPGWPAYSPATHQSLPASQPAQACPQAGHQREPAGLPAA